MNKKKSALEISNEIAIHSHNEVDKYEKALVMVKGFKKLAIIDFAHFLPFWRPYI